MSKSRDPARTIRQFAECNFNVKRTARHLDLHTNTVYFRLNRIRDLTGIDPRSNAGLSLLLTTVRMMGRGVGGRWGGSVTGGGRLEKKAN